MTRILGRPQGYAAGVPLKLVIREDVPYRSAELGLSPGVYEATWSAGNNRWESGGAELNVIMPRWDREDAIPLGQVNVFISRTDTGAVVGKYVYSPAEWVETGAGVFDLGKGAYTRAWVRTRQFDDLTEAAEGAALRAEAAAQSVTDATLDLSGERERVEQALADTAQSRERLEQVTHQANTAKDAANTAAGSANTAAQEANSARDAANDAARAANTAAQTAQNQASNAQHWAGQAQQATTAAATAAENANSAASDVNTAKTAANRAAESASAAASEANAARDAANTAAKNATIQADHVRAQGDYARQQGDYAKQQGDLAKDAIAGTYSARAGDADRLGGVPSAGYVRTSGDQTLAGSLTATNLLWGENGLRVEKAPDFGAPLPSGFYNTLDAPGAPTGASWHHLLHLRHGNPTNNVALQLASAHGSTELYWRNLAGGATSVATAPWLRVWDSGNFNPATKVDTTDPRLKDWGHFSVQAHDLTVYGKRALVGFNTDDGNRLIVNFGGDFGDGVYVNGPKLTVDGSLNVGAAAHFNGGAFVNGHAVYHAGNLPPTQAAPGIGMARLMGTSQSISPSVWTPLKFATDMGSAGMTVTNNRWTVNTAGKYLLTGSLVNRDGYYGWRLSVRVNGKDVVQYPLDSITTQPLANVLTLKAGDYVELWVYVDTISHTFTDISTIALVCIGS